MKYHVPSEKRTSDEWHRCYKLTLILLNPLRNPIIYKPGDKLGSIIYSIEIL